MNKPVKRVRFRAPRLALSRGKSLSYVKLLVQLKDIQAAPKTDSGICIQVSRRNVYNLDATSLSPLFIGWKYHSGDSIYPVPGTKTRSAERRYTETTHMWIGDYGDLRKDLLAHMIKKVEFTINEAKIKQGF